MREIKIFSKEREQVKEIRGREVELEKLMKKIIERKMEEFIGVRFIEYEFKKQKGGRMEQIGIEEKG